MMSVCLKNSKNMSKDDRKHGVIDQGKYRKITGKKNEQTDSIMFRIILMLHKNMRKCIVIQTSSQYYHFVVHIQSFMEQEGWVRIIIYVLIQT